MIKRRFALALALLFALSVLACAAPENGTGDGEAAAEVAGDYYIDLSELGMKLTIYLRLSENGDFLFSNTPDFELNKSSGTYQRTSDGYLMVYSSVNGQAKTASDGLTSKFITAGETLDFSVCERIYYGSASATTVSAEDESIKLIAKKLTPDHERQSEESAFTTGVYSLVDGGKSVFASFFDDETYLIFSVKRENNGMSFASEVGQYGVSTTSLALTPQGGERCACEVIDADTLDLSVPDMNGERQIRRFIKCTSEPSLLLTLTGGGKKTGTDEAFEASLAIYEDGSFEAEACGFKEKGVIAMNGADGSFKTYPDNPQSGVRGVSQVANVPSGSLRVNESGQLELSDFRIRVSDELGRHKCTFSENRAQ